MTDQELLGKEQILEDTKKYILLENQGEVAPEAFTLMGGTSKRGKDTIGQWGSGNKYTLAYLMRNNINFKIFSGEDEIAFDTVIKTFRGNTFKQITVNGKDTSLTTEMGFDWRPWFIVREAYSNCIDEGGENVVIDAVNPIGVKGKTRFYIEETDDFDKISKNWDQYFSMDRLDILDSNSKGTIFKNNNKNGYLNIYRKGIKCHNSKSNSLFHYNLDRIEINESRVVKHNFQVNDYIADVLKNTNNKEIIEAILYDTNIENFEFTLAWGRSFGNFSDTWLEILKNKKLIPREMGGFFDEFMGAPNTIVIPTSLATALKKDFPLIYVYGSESNDTSSLHKECKMTPKEKYLLIEANNLFDEVEYEIKYDKKKVKFSEKNVHGRANKVEILLGKKAFEKRRKHLVKVIIEENEHLNTEYGDNTREFQSHFINLFTTQMEERHGFFL